MKQKYYIDQQIKIFEAILSLTDLDKDNKIDLEDIASKLRDFENDNLDYNSYGDFKEESCVVGDAFDFNNII